MRCITSHESGWNKLAPSDLRFSPLFSNQTHLNHPPNTAARLETPLQTTTTSPAWNMVNLKSDFPVPASQEPDNTYWMVGGTAEEVESMKDSHVDYTPNPISADEMIARTNREERGLLPYRKYTKDDLKGFIKARNIKAATSRANKPDLIAILQHEDDNPEFGKILELPGEIRKRIYSEYVKDLPAPLPEMAVQPPLTLASKLIRHETVPVFNRNATFLLHFGTNAGTTSGVRRGTEQLRTFLLPSAKHLERVATDEDLSEIRKFKVEFTLVGYKGKDYPLVKWYFNLDDIHKPEIGDLRDWKSSRYWAVRQYPMNEAILGVVLAMRERSKGSQFCRADIEALRQALHKAVQQ